jgi:hypothetical protein
MLPQNHPALTFFQHAEATYPNLWRLADEVQQRFRHVGHKEGCVFTKAEAITVSMRLPGEKLVISPIVLGALIAWRPTKGIYRFHPGLYDAVTATDLTGDVPSELLTRLPGYAVYIEAPGLLFFDKKIIGFWAYLSSAAKQNAVELVPLFADGSAHGLSVPLGHHPVSDLARLALAAMFEESNMEYEPTADEWQRLNACLSSMFSLLLYLCSEKPEIDGWTPPVPQAKFFGGQRRWLQAKSVHAWDVGLRLGAALDLAKQRDAEQDHSTRTGAGVPVRPHIRRAHWHSFWVGKRGEQTISLRWLPPIPVNVGENTELPAVIHPVKASSGATEEGGYG